MPTYNYIYRNVNWTSGTFKLALLSNSYVPSRSHDFFNDVSAYEISGTGYTAGGVTLTNVAVNRDANGFRDEFFSDGASWTGLAATSVRYAALYEATGVAATSPLIAYYDLGGPYTPVDADCDVAPNSNGWVDVRYET